MLRAIELSPEDVPTLIQAGADLEERDGYFQRTPLLLAVDLARWDEPQQRPKIAMRDAVVALLHAGADVEASNEQGETPLQIAAESRPSYSPLMPEIAALLLAHGADANRLDNYSFSPLDRAYRAANGGIVRALWAVGARFAKTVNAEVDPLHREQADLLRAAELSLASLLGDTTEVDRLLEQGIDINSWDIHGRTALHATARSGDAAMVAHLLARGADIHAREHLRDEASNTPIGNDAYWVKHPEWEDVIIYPRQGYMPLHGAAEEGHPEVIRLLLSHGADVHALNGPSGEPALAIAAWQVSWNHRSHDEAMECVRILLDAGYKQDSSLSPEETHRNLSAIAQALGSAAWGGHLELITLLLEYGAGKRRADILSAVKRATTDNGFNSLPLLWEAGKRLASPLTLVETLPFMSGIWGNNDNSICTSLRFLFEAHPEIDVTIPDPATGETPLLWLMRNVEKENDHIPSDDEQEIHRRDNSPEPWSSYFEKDVINLLLSHGADPDAQDFTGESALSVAEAKGYERIVAIFKQPITPR